MEGDQFSLGESKEEPHVILEPSAVPVACSDEDDIYEALSPFQEGQGQTEAEICSEEKCSQSPNCSMTTKELQEYWRNEKRSCREVKVLFEIPSARIVDKPFSKYVVFILEAQHLRLTMDELKKHVHIEEGSSELPTDFVAASCSTLNDGLDLQKCLLFRTPPVDVYILKIYCDCSRQLIQNV